MTTETLNIWPKFVSIAIRHPSVVHSSFALFVFCSQVSDHPGAFIIATGGYSRLVSLSTKTPNSPPILLCFCICLLIVDKHLSLFSLSILQHMFFADSRDEVMRAIQKASQDNIGLDVS